MKNININEGLDAINRIKLLMEYSLDKTLNENLSEQTNNSEYKFDGPFYKINGEDFTDDVKKLTLEKKGDKLTVTYYITNFTKQPIIIQNVKGMGDFGYKGGQNVSFTKQPILPNQKGVISYDIIAKTDEKPTFANFSSEIQFLLNNGSKVEKLPNVSLFIPQLNVETWTDHEWLKFVSIAMLFIPGGGIVSLAAATTFGLLDAIEYYKEGNKEEAGITAILSLLPVSAELRELFSPISNLSKITKSLLSKIINKGSKSVLNQEEKAVVELITNNKEYIISKLKNLAVKTAKTTKNVAKEFEPYVIAQHVGDEFKKNREKQVYDDDFKSKILEDNPSIKQINSIEVIKLDNKNIPSELMINNQRYLMKIVEYQDDLKYKLTKI